MKPWLKRTLVGIFGASALLGSISACSHHHHGNGWQSMSAEDASKFKARAVDRVAGKLDLSADQKAKLGVLLDRLHEQHTALLGATDPRRDMQALFADATFDRWHAQDLVNNKLAAVRDKSPQVVAAMGDFYDSLDPEQQQKVRDFLQRGGRHFGHHG